MLNELSRYENLGTPKIFFELFGKLGSNKQSWTSHNLREYLYNRIIDGHSIFDGCLPFAEKIGAMTVGKKGIITLNPKLEHALSSEKHFSFRFLETALLAIKDDETFHQIFCSKNISYDIIYRQIQIDSGAFQFRYANFRHLLVSFSFLQPHPDIGIRKLIINPQYKKLFDSNLMPEIKKRKIGIEQLEKMLAQKQIYGKEAEDFALRYERKRLGKHSKVQFVEIISTYDIGAGYDIASYDGNDSEVHDRFIEVKSYAENPSFHWSRNEMDVARIKKGQYYLYLVDRAKIKDEAYAPLIIQNPHEQILERPDLWEKRVEDYFITKMVG